MYNLFRKTNVHQNIKGFKIIRKCAINGQTEAKFENCYGIQKMDAMLDYSKNNVAIIYAPNGTMKSSLAKTFESIRDNKPVQERVFGLTSVCNILDEANNRVPGDEIIVINPFDENAFENQGMLMANDELRKKYLLVYKSIEDKKNYLYEQVKAKLKYSPRSSFETKNSMLKIGAIL